LIVNKADNGEMV